MLKEQLPYDDPLGKTLIISGKKQTIVGISENYHFDHVFQEMGPSVLAFDNSRNNYLYVKTSHGLTPAVETYFKKVWAGLFPDVPFEIDTMLNYFNLRFNDSKKGQDLNTLIGYIAILFHVSAFSDWRCIRSRK